MQPFREGQIIHLSSYGDSILEKRRLGRRHGAVVFLISFAADRQVLVLSGQGSARIETVLSEVESSYSLRGQGVGTLPEAGKIQERAVHTSQAGEETLS